MLEIKSELISDEEEETEPDVGYDPNPVQPISNQIPTNVTYIIAHGPNGLISIPIHRQR